MLAGCGIGGRSPFGDKAFIMARVLPEHRRRGVGSRARARARRARSRARPQRRQLVRRVARRRRRSASPRSSASRRSTTSSSRCVGSVPKPSPRCRRASRWSRSPTAARSCSPRRWPVAQQGYEDMPLPGAVTHPRRELAARRGDAARGLVRRLRRRRARRLRRDDRARERRRDRRARADRRPARPPAAWDRAGAEAVAAALGGSERGRSSSSTWTQKGNEAMQALNASLGYVTRSRALTMQGPIP